MAYYGNRLGSLEEDTLCFFTLYQIMRVGTGAFVAVGDGSRLGLFCFDARAFCWLDVLMNDHS